MRLDRFTATRQERWQALEALINRAQRKGIRALGGQEILQLGRLYRETSADLAIARRDFPHEGVVPYLNALLARAHPLIYRERAIDLARLGCFWRYGFPAAYRETAPYIVLAFLLTLASALLAAGLVVAHAANADLLLPGQAAGLRAILAQHRLWMASATSNHSAAANFIMLNNIKVAILAFAGGALAGMGTVAILILNGINLGVTAALVAQYGLSGGLWSFVAPHGVIELSVIFMAAGAGLRLGDAILRPGPLPRGDALAQAARGALALMVGAVPLLVLAGTIEGFFSASSAPVLLKYAVGGVSGLLLYSYLLLSRPHNRPRSFSSR